MTNRRFKPPPVPPLGAVPEGVEVVDDAEDVDDGHDCEAGHVVTQRQEQ